MEQVNNDPDNEIQILRTKILKQKERIKRRDAKIEYVNYQLTKNTTKFNVRLQKLEKELNEEREKCKIIESKLTKSEEKGLKLWELHALTKGERDLALQMIQLQDMKKTSISEARLTKINKLLSEQQTTLKQTTEFRKTLETSLCPQAQKVSPVQKEDNDDIQIIYEKLAAAENEKTVEAESEMELSDAVSELVCDEEGRQPIVTLTLTSTHYFY